MLVALVFHLNGKRAGIAVKTEELAPGVWDKLNGGNLSKQIIAGGTIHVVSKATWAPRITRDGVPHRPKFARRIPTGEPVNVTEASVEALLAAIAADAVELEKMPVEPEPWSRREDHNPNLHHHPICAP